MTKLPPFAIKRLYVLAGAALVAVLTWGLYAWKSSPQGAAVPVAAEENAGAGPRADAQGAQAPAETLTALRATRSASLDGLGELGSAVQPNARISIDDAVAVRVPPAPTPQDQHVSSARPAPPPFGSSPEPVAPPQGPGSAGGAQALLKSARDAMSAGNLVAARRDYTQALRFGLPPDTANEVRDELSRLAEALVFTRANVADDPLTRAHVVRPGERLALIAARERVTPEFLAELNALDNPNLLHAGARIKIVHGPFHAVIYKSAHRMDVSLGDVVLRSYRVGLGAEGGTPLGQWMVGGKLQDPDWTDPSTGRYYAADDPQNPIGDHWIALECLAGDCLGRRGFGVHGTIEPDSIGADRSMGCVRLTPEDIAAVYDLFVPKDSRIEIKP